MKRISSLFLFEIIISVTSGILMSKMSWLGKLGISLVKTEYKILKTWWKTALIIFGIQILLILIQWTVKKYFSLNTSRLVFFLLLLIGFAGLGYTYYDFTNVFEHKLMKEKFHLGCYIFWFGWITSNLYFMITPYTKKEENQ